ncbi:MAG: hypothetical protein HUJ56_09575 [Erysipelotrichaceae bacterium]|nr:hypothetical protein [Erysipelotrichaceae bacterium]
MAKEETNDLLDIEFQDTSIDFGLDNSEESNENDNQEGNQENDTPDNQENENNSTEEGQEPNPANSKTNPESVGTDNKERKSKDTQDSAEKGSPNDFTSIAQYLQSLDIFKTLSKEDIDKYISEHSNESTDDAIHGLMELEVENRMDSNTKRVHKALNGGVSESVIATYEKYINILNHTTDELLKGENDEAENNRRIIIVQNYMNKGIPQKEAEKLANISIESGDDIEDAIAARDEMLVFYQQAYDKEISDSNKKIEETKRKNKQDLEDLRKSIIEDDKVFKDLDISSTDRMKIYDAVTKPIETREGKKLTAVQKFALDNPNEYYKLLGMVYVLTEGGTKVDNLVKGTVRKTKSNASSEFAKLIGQKPLKDNDMGYKAGVGAEMGNFSTLEDIEFN